MPWIMEVRIELPRQAATEARGGTRYEWRAVHATGSRIPYEYPTRAEAMGMLRICYPDQTPEEVRVREVWGGSE